MPYHYGTRILGQILCVRIPKDRRLCMLLVTMARVFLSAILTKWMLYLWLIILSLKVLTVIRLHNIYVCNHLPRSTQPGHPYVGNEIMNTSEFWEMNRHTCTAACRCFLQMQAFLCLSVCVGKYFVFELSFIICYKSVVRLAARI